jgi:hypothetical protein
VFECVPLFGPSESFCTAGLDGHSVGGDGRSIVLSMRARWGPPLLGLYFLQPRLPVVGRLL